MAASLFALAATVAQAEKLDAPNVVPITEQLVTSGQPTAEALAGLRAAGYLAVIYLAPFSAPNSVRQEPEILAKQGIEFVHVPIPFGSPEPTHVRAVSDALERLKDKKVLVHCEVNMRASSIVFLHRVIRLKEDPAAAWASVTRVWTPTTRGPWKPLIESQLREAGVKFELL